MVGVFELSLGFLVVSLAGALNVNIPKDEYEFARGDNITLPCVFTPNPARPKPTLVVITWTVDGGDPDIPDKLVLTHYTGRPTDIVPLYEGRTTLDHDIPKGKADLKLRGITMQDNKVFKCRVLIPGDDEGKLADLTNVVVLVAPSTPVCKIEGKAEYGQNINLTCRSEEGSPTPVYSWAQQDVRQTPRIAAPRTTDKGGVLSLFNVSMETSGYYTCTSKNKIRSASCNITLTVSPPSMNMGATAGLIGGGVAALLVLGIVIYCCCCRKKKEEKEKEEYAMGTPGEGEFQKEPEVNGERRDDRAEDDRSEAGTARRDYDDRRNDRDAPRSDYDAPRSDYDAPRSDYDDRRSEFSDRRSDYDDRRDRNDPRNDDRADRRRDDYRDEDNREDRRRDDYRDEDDREDSRRRDDYEDSERGGRPEPPRVPGNKPPSRGNYDV